MNNNYSAINAVLYSINLIHIHMKKLLINLYWQPIYKQNKTYTWPKRQNLPATSNTSEIHYHSEVSGQ